MSPFICHSSKEPFTVDVEKVVMIIRKNPDYTSVVNPSLLIVLDRLLEPIYVEFDVEYIRDQVAIEIEGVMQNISLRRITALGF